MSDGIITLEVQEETLIIPYISIIVFSQEA
jgi:hypothetical protein